MYDIRFLFVKGIFFRTTALNIKIITGKTSNIKKNVKCVDIVTSVV